MAYVSVVYRQNGDSNTEFGTLRGCGCFRIGGGYK
jgi:hypothetical protein